ncbi:MAG: hypothetical protein ACYDA2_10525 [Acidimicrobiales bacterium]
MSAQNAGAELDAPGLLETLGLLEALEVVLLPVPVVLPESSSPPAIVVVVLVVPLSSSVSSLFLSSPQPRSRLVLWSPSDELEWSDADPEGLSLL